MLNRTLNLIVSERRSGTGGKAKPYVVAFALVVAGDLFRRAFLQSLGAGLPFITFFPAVMLAALYGGFRGGVFATLLSATGVSYFWMEPVYSFTIGKPANLIAMALFISANIFMSWMAERLLQTSKRVLELEASRREELVGRHINILMPPRVRAAHDRYLAEFRGCSLVKDMEALHKNGEPVPLHVALTEWRDGEGRRFLTVILHDITERKRNEEALANARRLEAVGQLAGGVAHNYNNLLAVIAGNLEFVEDRTADQETRDLIRRALDAAEKGSSLNRRLLSLVKKRSVKPELVTLNHRVEETVKLLKSTLAEQIAISVDLASDLWTTLADPGEIDSAILNIAANARDAMPEGGKIAIMTSNVTLETFAATKLSPDAKPGEYVRLAITDNGAGMPPEVLGKAMEPFFTTKGAGGTGLGLTSVAYYAKQTGGFATIASTPGDGCIASLYLPRSIENARMPAIKDRVNRLGHGELVLVVEDDDQVREVTLKRVEALGYAVEAARNGAEAIERLKSGAPIQAILSDIVMPGGVTGYEVASWVSVNIPEIKVILCSGYDEGDSGGDREGPSGVVAQLPKPYTRGQLVDALSIALPTSRAEI